MRRRKLAACPKCIPDGRSIFLAGCDFDDSGQATLVWRCTNCGHIKRFGGKRRSSAAVDRALASIRQAVETSGSEMHPVTIKEWTVKCHEDGSVDLTVYANQGGEGNLLAAISSRLLGIRISPMGGINLYYDSKAKDKKELRSRASQLRRGRLYVW